MTGRAICFGKMSVLELLSYDKAGKLQCILLIIWVLDGAPILRD